jgi:hypothetical protein
MLMKQQNNGRHSVQINHIKEKLDIKIIHYPYETSSTLIKYKCTYFVQLMKAWTQTSV